ncbi:hypothetical protein D3C81_2276140 [compost metagenome]
MALVDRHLFDNRIVGLMHFLKLTRVEVPFSLHSQKGVQTHAFEVVDIFGEQEFGFFLRMV